MHINILKNIKYIKKKYIFKNTRYYTRHTINPFIYKLYHFHRFVYLLILVEMYTQTILY